MRAGAVSPQRVRSRVLHAHIEAAANRSRAVEIMDPDATSTGPAAAGGPPAPPTCARGRPCGLDGPARLRWPFECPALTSHMRTPVVACDAPTLVSGRPMPHCIQRARSRCTVCHCITSMGAVLIAGVERARRRCTVPTCPLARATLARLSSRALHRSGCHDRAERFCGVDDKVSSTPISPSHHASFVFEACECAMSSQLLQHVHRASEPERDAPARLARRHLWRVSHTSCAATGGRVHTVATTHSWTRHSAGRNRVAGACTPAAAPRGGCGDPRWRRGAAVVQRCGSDVAALGRTGGAATDARSRVAASSMHGARHPAWHTVHLGDGRSLRRVPAGGAAWAGGVSLCRCVGTGGEHTPLQSYHSGSEAVGVDPGSRDRACGTLICLDECYVVVLSVRRTVQRKDGEWV